MKSQAQGIEIYQAIPKVELHRHLEGSLRFETIQEVARSHDLNLPGTGPLRSLVHVQEEEPYTFENFLSKFDTLRLLYRSPEIIARVTYEAILDAAADNVRYIELRFTPVALSRAGKFPLSEVIDWVISGVSQAEAERDIQVGLVASINRHESVQLGQEVVRLAIDNQSRGVFGIDLAGNEAQFSALPFVSLFKEAHQAGLHTVVHAGEWGGAANVKDAIQVFEADRIGHGVRVLEDPVITALASERGTCFEVCITSNYQTGVVPSLSAHPLPRMLAAGINVAIGTDDPSICRTTLSQEYQTACENLGVPLDVLRSLVLSSAKAAFLPEKERQALVQQLQK